MLKKAMIMAAGVGSRLGPLSNVLPKPLVPIVNTPAMDILVKHLISYGIKDVIANTYYKAEDIKNHYSQNASEINFQFITEKELSGTAGGVKKCQFFFDKEHDFIIMSGDGLTDIDINKAYESHKNSGSIATIVVKNVEHKDVNKYGIIVQDKNGFVESFQEKPSMEEAKSNLANTGIYIFSYDIFNFIPENTFYDFAKNVFPSLMKQGIKINTYVHNGYWSDIGSIEQYKLSNADILNKKVKSFIPDVIKTEYGQYVYGDNLIMKQGAKIEGNCVIGNNCTLGRNCIIRNSILWDNIKTEDNIIIENSVILPNTIVQEDTYDKIISETIKDKISV